MIIKSKIFGDVDFGQEYFDKHDISLNGHDLSCTLSAFWGDDESPSTDKALAPKVGALLDLLPKLDKNIRAEFHTRYHQGDEVIKETYIEHHLDDCGDQCAAQIAEKLGTKEHDHLLFLNKLELVCVSPEYNAESGLSMVIDYSIGKEITQYVLAVRVDETGSILEIEMES